MAAASAWQLSQKSKVFIVSLDPAHNLGDIFGLDVKGGTKNISKNLSLQEVNLQKLSQDYLEQETDVLSSTYAYLKTLNLDKYFSTLKYSPGIEEYALLTCISKTIKDNAFADYLIFDTPPTGLTLRFLALPQVAMTWIDRLTHIRRQILEKRYTIHRIKGSLSTEETVLDYKEEDDHILKRLGTLKDTYQSLSRRLQGQDCAIILVFNPDMLSLRESERLITGFKELGLPLRLLINNKVSAENQETARQVEENIKAMAEGVLLERIHWSRSVVHGEQGSMFDISENIIPESW